MSRKGRDATASAIFGRGRATPAAPAALSHRTARAQRQEGCFGVVAGAGAAVQRPFGSGPEVLVEVAGLARRGPLVAGNLDRPGRSHMGDHDVLTVTADPSPSISSTRAQCAIA